MAAASRARNTPEDSHDIGASSGVVQRAGAAATALALSLTLAAAPA
jgi:hypothetical protein